MRNLWRSLLDFLGWFEPAWMYWLRTRNDDPTRDAIWVGPVATAHAYGNALLKAPPGTMLYSVVKIVQPGPDGAPFAFYHDYAAVLAHNQTDEAVATWLADQVRAGKMLGQEPCIGLPQMMSIPDSALPKEPANASL